ncbi:MAG: M3 family metallopeptidase [Saprospiraceae bacterium]
MKNLKIVCMILFCFGSASVISQNNPLLEAYNTPFNAVPFDKLETSQFLPAIEEAAAKGKMEIEAIINNAEEPTFQNTILALENAGKDVSRISKIVFNLNGMETTPELQKAIKSISALLTEYRNDIFLNADLFAKVKEVYESRSKLKLDAESAMLLEKSYKSFSRNGANLTEESKVQLRDMNKKMSELGLKFGENVLKETNEFVLYLMSEDDVKGLPDYVKSAAKEAAAKDGKEGYKFTIHAPSYSPFMQYAENRDLRQELYMAYNTRAFKDNANNNKEIVTQIANYRYQKAQLLGYETWADYILEERMANKKQIVLDFLDDIKESALPVAINEVAELTEYAKKNGFKGDQLEKWDFSYYAEKLKKEKFDINDEVLKPYFSLENTINGLFELCTELWGITFKKNTEVATWNSDVMVYEIYDKDGKFLALWYGDYFPRSGKRAGAWNNTLQDMWVQDGKEYRPHVVNVCNFTKPTGDKPALLTFNEVETLYHEFGHALHNIFAEGKYSTLTGTSVAWDFVELPSQLMENFVSEPQILNKFAKHYETGEVIPQQLVQKIKESSTFMSGLGTMRQISMGYLDMTWHGNNPEGFNIEEVEDKADVSRQFYPDVAGVAVSTAFSHIFAGGYSAGYYSYKWSEVLDADAYDMFKQNGVVNKAVAQSFRDNILSKGGSVHAMELFVNFRGREPKVDAMLMRSGLVPLP